MPLKLLKKITNNPLEETIEIYTNNLFKNSDIVYGFEKSEFKDLLSLGTKESYFILNNILDKQIDGVAMRSPFLAHHEQNWLDSFPLEYRPSNYRRYVDDTFALFKPSDHLKRF